MANIFVFAETRAGVPRKVALEAVTVVVTHPMDIGKSGATVSISGTPEVIAMRPNVIAPAANAKAGRVEVIQPALDPAKARVIVKETRQGGGGKLDLADAPVV